MNLYTQTATPIHFCLPQPYPRAILELSLANHLKTPYHNSQVVLIDSKSIPLHHVSPTLTRTIIAWITRSRVPHIRSSPSYSRTLSTSHPVYWPTAPPITPSFCQITTPHPSPSWAGRDAVVLELTSIHVAERGNASPSEPRGSAWC